MAAGNPMIAFLYNGSDELKTPSKDAYPAGPAPPDVGDSVAALLVKKKEKKRRRR